MRHPAITIFLLLTAYSTYAYSGVDSSGIYFAKARTFQEQRRWNDAENHYKKAVAFQPKNIEILHAFAQYYLDLRKYKDAKVILEQIYQQQPSDTTTLSQLATLAYNLKKFPEAVIHLSALSKVSPSEFTFLRLGKAYVETEDFGKAIAAFEAALKLNPKNGEVNYELARSYITTNNYKKAIPYYKEAIVNESQKYAWVYELGLLYYSLNEHANAIASFEQAASLGMPKDLTYLENLGMVQLATKDYQTGIATLESILEKKPNDGHIMYQIAQAWYKHEKYDKAREMWDKVFTNDPTNFRALYMIGMAWQKSGKITKGREVCDRAIAGDPSLATMKIEKFSF